MKIQNKVFLIFTICLLAFQSVFVFAQEPEKKPRFSNIGLKAALSSGSSNVISERRLEEGDMGSFSLGYGFTNTFSLWLSMVGSEHTQKNSDEVMEFGGLEINLQHKFNALSAWQPYTKIGFGVYGLQEKDTDMSLIGAGINLGLGVDYFFSKHFGVGAEFTYKKLDYFAQSRKTDEGDLVTDISPNLNGDTTGFMLTFTVQ